MAKAAELKKGAKVQWNTSQGPTTGKVVKRITHDTAIKSHHVKASADSPQFEVESERSHAHAAHKASSLQLKKK